MPVGRVSAARICSIRACTRSTTLNEGKLLIWMLARARAGHLCSLPATRSLASVRVKCFALSLSHFSLRLLAWLSVSGVAVGAACARAPEVGVTRGLLHAGLEGMQAPASGWACLCADAAWRR